MGNSKTIVCPNCGAVSSNLDNCEYCGSILVKVASILQEEGKDVTKELKELGIEKSAYVNPVMLEAIEKCVIQCQKYNTEIRCCFIYDEPGELVIPPRWSHDLPYVEGKYHIVGPKLIFQPNSAPILEVHFSMNDNYHNSCFKRLEINQLATLFEITQAGNTMCCKMQMDNDAKTTAQFISFFFSQIYYKSDDKIETETYVTINEIEYLIATDKQDKILNEKFNDTYSDYLKKLRGEQYASDRVVKQCDEIIYNILKQLANVSAWELGKKQQLQQRYQDRYELIATRKHFINTRYWESIFRNFIHAEGGSHWITENTTVEEIKKMAQEVSVAEEPEVVCHDTSNDNVSDDSTMQYQDINNSSNAAAQSSNLQDIAKQFVETLGKEIQAKTNINITHWIIIVLILVIIILIASI